MTLRFHLLDDFPNKYNSQDYARMKPEVRRSITKISTDASQCLKQLESALAAMFIKPRHSFMMHIPEPRGCLSNFTWCICPHLFNIFLSLQVMQFKCDSWRQLIEISCSVRWKKIGLIHLHLNYLVIWLKLISFCF